MIKVIILTSTIIYFVTNGTNTTKTENIDCTCDTIVTKQIITQNDFNRIPKYDTFTFKKDDFYTLDSSINKKLWYRDIENIDTTKFTNQWNDYLKANYRASHLDFVEHYDNKKEIEIAFQLGPNSDLWAYHTFVIKKIGCCFLATRSYFRHARFTYKAYSIIDKTAVDSLFATINKLNRYPVTEKPTHRYLGYFADNRNNNKFFIDFDKETRPVNNNNDELEATDEVKQFINFIDKKIKWIKTYSL